MKFVESKSDGLTDLLFSVDGLGPPEAPTITKAARDALRFALQRLAPNLVNIIDLAGIAGRDEIEPPSDRLLIAIAGALAARNAGADEHASAAVAENLSADDALVAEIAATRRATQAARRSGLDRLPLRRFPGDDPETDAARPLFDFTTPAARSALALSLGDPSLAEADPGSESGLGRLLSAMERSPLVTYSPALESGLRGVFSLFGGMLEARANTAAASGPPGGRVNFTLQTNTPSIVVDYHYQARYDPKVFGKTGLNSAVTAPLDQGIYCFETRSLGSPPPLPDTGTHSCDPQQTSSATVAF